MATDQQAAAASGARNQTAETNDYFIQHLEHASKVVKTWPAWKQELLGGKAGGSSESCLRGH